MELHVGYSEDDGFERIDMTGMEFGGENQAYEYYRKHGLSHGFDVRKTRLRRRVDGSCCGREFCCSCAGEKHSSVIDGSHERASFRSNCRAFVRFKIDMSGTWKCDRHDRQHSHPFVPQHQTHFLHAARHIDDSKKNMLMSFMQIGIRAIDAFRIMYQECGGIESVGFTKRDLYNFFTREKSIQIGSADAQSLLDCFKERYVCDGNFYYQYQVVDGRLGNFIWRDSRMYEDYQCFGDVVVFDTTYRTNMYGLICAPFVGENNHRQIVIFGCGFLINEEKETFGWLFDQFLESMGGVQPSTFMTDQDATIMFATERHLPGSKHRLCLWHISQNARKHLGWLMNSNKEFSRALSRCFYGCITVQEFIERWSNMIETFGLEGNSWLESIFALREKWCPAYCRDVFSAGNFPSIYVCCFIYCCLFFFS